MSIKWIGICFRARCLAVFGALFVVLSSIIAFAEEAEEENNVLSFFDAIKKNDYGEMLRLVYAGVDVNATDSNGNTGLMWAIVKEGRGIQTFLLAPRWNADVNIQNKRGETALIWAVKIGDIEAVSLLRNKNANAKLAARVYKETALMLAAEHGVETIVDMVLELENDLEAVDIFDRTALVKALEKKHWAVALKLGAKGANMEAAWRSEGFRKWKAEIDDDRQGLVRQSKLARWCGRIFGWFSDAWDN